MAFNPKTEALAFRIWQVCEPECWNLSLREVADLMGESVHRIRKICQMKGWLSRLRASAISMSGNPEFISVDEVMA